MVLRDDVDLGYNYRITDLPVRRSASASSTASTVPRSPQETSPTVYERLSPDPRGCACPPANRQSAWHLYVVRVRPVHTASKSGQSIRCPAR